ncbi:hypothetical protein ACFHW2_37335 [Actinomadura sp. LOL_016]|uniref:hypothetical protein n=1 Tax=unclassified Actinomadura TaxID=2626254 RepID=UPI003A7FB6B4
MTAFTARTADLGDAVNRAARLVPDPAPIPAWTGILFAAVDGAVEVVACDGPDLVRARVGADVEAPGLVLVEGAQVARIARNLPGADTRIRLDEMFAVVASGPVQYRLLTLPDWDFPTERAATIAVEELRPVRSDQQERTVSANPALMRGAKLPKKHRVPRPSSGDGFAPSGLEPGAPITWTRRVDGDAVKVTGQVWDAAPGRRAVWALAEGERPVRVEEHSYGEMHEGKHRTFTRLEEVAPPAAERAA